MWETSIILLISLISAASSQAGESFSIPKAVRPVFTKDYENQPNPIQGWTPNAEWSQTPLNPKIEGRMDLTILKSLELRSDGLLQRLLTCAGGDAESARALYLNSFSGCKTDPALVTDVANLHASVQQFIVSTEIENIVRENGVDFDTIDQFQLPAINPLLEQVLLETLADTGYFWRLDYERDTIHGGYVMLPGTTEGHKKRTVMHWIGRIVLSPVETVDPVNLVRPSPTGRGYLTDQWDSHVDSNVPAPTFSREQTQRISQTVRVLVVMAVLSSYDHPHAWGFWPKATESIFFGLSSSTDFWGGGLNGVYSKGDPGTLLFITSKRAAQWQTEYPIAMTSPPHWEYYQEVVETLRNLKHAYLKAGK
jgi:hypothetical protein